MFSGMAALKRISCVRWLHVPSPSAPAGGCRNLRMVCALLAASLLLPSLSAHAEGKVRIAQQFGIGYLILDVVRDRQLIQKHGGQVGSEIDVDWSSLPHPDATAALIAGGSEINTHFSSAPFYYQALAANKNVHKVISSYDILGGPATFNVLYSTQKFHDENPKTYKAFYNALVEAAQLIKADKASAADIFIRVQNSKLPRELIRKIIDDPENDFTVSPHRTYVYAEELHKLGVLKNKAASWKEYFFEEAHALPGS